MNPRKLQDIAYRTRVPVVAGMTDRAAVAFLVNYLQKANLKKQSVTNEHASDEMFESNAEFWEEAFTDRRMGLRWVKLQNFSLVDWFPRSPGLYHTHEAKYVRLKARRHITRKRGYLVYKPHGKMHMINGGIGSLRFKPIRILDEDCWLCTATSDDSCHTGIPLAVPNDLFQQWDFDYERSFEITGQVHYLPAALEEYFYHTSALPQFYVLVDKLAGGRARKARPLISPMVFFAADDTETRARKQVTYVNCRADDEYKIDAAADWLEDYVHKYSGEILTNFDQQRPTFRDAPFGLHKLMRARIRVSDVERLDIRHANILCETITKVQGKEIAMSKIDVRLGDGVTVHGDMVVASSIKSSFNKASSADVPDNLRDLLKQLAGAVGKMTEQQSEEDAENSARDLDTLTTEATSKVPRIKWWELSVEGLKDAAKAVGDIGKPVLALLPKIAEALQALG